VACAADGDDHRKLIQHAGKQVRHSLEREVGRVAGGEPGRTRGQGEHRGLAGSLALSCQPASAERPLAFSALDDLFGGVAEEILPAAACQHDPLTGCPRSLKAIQPAPQARQ